MKRFRASSRWPGALGRFRQHTSGHGNDAGCVCVQLGRPSAFEVGDKPRRSKGGGCRSHRVTRPLKQSPRPFPSRFRRRRKWLALLATREPDNRSSSLSTWMNRIKLHLRVYPENPSNDSGPTSGSPRRTSKLWSQRHLRNQRFRYVNVLERRSTTRRTGRGRAIATH